MTSSANAAFDTAYRTHRIEQGDDDSSTSRSEESSPNHLPLSCIPDALTNLGLPSNDASVLSLFSETARLPPGARRRPGVAPEKVIARDEFLQVADILLQEQGSRAKRRAAAKGRQSLQDLQGDASGDSEDEFGAEPSSPSEIEEEEFARARRVPKIKRKQTTPSDEEEVVKKKRPKVKTETVVRLNPDQREQAAASFHLFLEQLPRKTTHLTVEDLRIVAQAVGEKISDKDLEDMITEGIKMFAPASSSEATRTSASHARSAASGLLASQGLPKGECVGLDEYVPLPLFLTG